MLASIFHAAVDGFLQTTSQLDSIVKALRLNTMEYNVFDLSNRLRVHKQLASCNIFTFHLMQDERVKVHNKKKVLTVNLFNWVNLVKRLDYTDGYNTVLRFRTLGNIGFPIKTLLHIEVMHEWANIKEAVTSAVSVRAIAARLLEGRG